MPDSLPEGGAQGFDAGAQTWPTVELPLGIPFTVHVTAGFVVPVTVAAKLARWPAVTDADAGATATEMGTLLRTVTVAEAVCEPAVASIVTGFVPGALAGAV